MQLKKFKEIFDYARDNSKFYQDLYKKNGIMNLEIKSYKDIEKVPIVTKAMLREYKINDIVTCRIDKQINIHSTSGSTGEPFKIAYSKYEDYISHVRLTREIMKYGYNPFKKMVLISRYEPGHKFEIEEDMGIIKKLQKSYNLFPRVVISMFEPLGDIIKQLKIIKPFVVWSTPSFISLLANKLEETKEKLNIPLLFLMAETISPLQILMFKKYLCKDIIDAYGCMESPSMGYSINSIDYKSILPNTTLTEVINYRSYNGNQVGDIIITNLQNKTMPFIRYDLGDYVGVLNEDSFPIKKIGRVQGRLDDILIMEDGSTLSFHQTYHLFNDFHDVEQYKFIQLKDKSIILQLKIKFGKNKKDVSKKATDIWSKYFPKTKIKVEFVDNFKIKKKTGKFKVIEKI
ncbi:phenylacetate--CoA ligase family protein [bacterium]|nr:phenylacetate--CoA ligase family protein [bacterium]